MGQREQDDRLKQIRNSGKTIYSISRLDCINRCLAEAYITYKKHDRGKQNIYTLTGSRLHETLEDITNGKATEEDLLPAMYEELENAEVLGLDFPKSRDGSSSIRDSWISDITHFCNTYKAPKANLTTEELFIYETSKGYILQGYIDLQRINKDGSIDIYDYKSSSMYVGDAIKEHSRQLLVYCMGKEQEGFNVKSVNWIFLKYADIKFFSKKTVKSKEKTLNKKTVERRKIGAEMSKYVERDLTELGYSEIDIEIILSELKETNLFDCLPDEIRNNYKITPCVYNFEITEDNKKECEDYINNTIEMWEALTEDESDYPPLQFLVEQKNGKIRENTFYCSQLCSHSDKCIYYRDYLNSRNIEDEDDDDLF